MSPVLLAIVAAVMPRVVAVTPTVPLLLVEDVAGVTVVGVATRVPDALLYRSQLDTVVHCACLRPGRRAYRGCLVPSHWWGVHRGLVVLLVQLRQLLPRLPRAYETQSSRPAALQQLQEELTLPCADYGPRA